MEIEELQYIKKDSLDRLMSAACFEETVYDDPDAVNAINLNSDDSDLLDAETNVEYAMLDMDFAVPMRIAEFNNLMKILAFLGNNSPLYSRLQTIETQIKEDK